MLVFFAVMIVNTTLEGQKHLFTLSLEYKQMTDQEFRLLSLGIKDVEAALLYQDLQMNSLGLFLV